MLANKLIGSREIKNNIGTSKGEIIARRSWCPYIFANLNAKLNTIAGYKQKWLGRNVNRIACKVDISRIKILS